MIPGPTLQRSSPAERPSDENWSWPAETDHSTDLLDTAAMLSGGEHSGLPGDVGTMLEEQRAAMAAKAEQSRADEVARVREQIDTLGHDPSAGEDELSPPETEPGATGPFVPGQAVVHLGEAGFTVAALSADGSQATITRPVEGVELGERVVTMEVPTESLKLPEVSPEPPSGPSPRARGWLNRLRKWVGH